MAFQFGFRKNRPVTILINDYVIRALDIKERNPLTIKDHFERYLPSGIVKNGKIIDEETFALILDECIDEWKLAKRRVNFHVSDTYVVIRKIDVPANLQNDEIYGHLYMEIGSTIHLPFEQPVFDFTVIGSNEENKQLILFAAPEEYVLTISQLLEEVKLVPNAADISSLSLYRLYKEVFQPQSEEQLLIVEANLHSVNVSIFEGQYPVFMRNIPIEADNEKWTASKLSGPNVSLTYDGEIADLNFALEDIYTEVVRVIDFYRYTLNHGAKQIDKLFVTGDHPLITNIQNRLKERVSLPMVTIEKDDLKTAANDIPLQASFHCAVGLSLKGV